MIIPNFYGGGERAYFDACHMIEHALEVWAGRNLTISEKWDLSEFMEKLKPRTSTSFEDRALESLIEEAHGINS